MNQRKKGGEIKDQAREHLVLVSRTLRTHVDGKSSSLASKWRIVI